MDFCITSLENIILKKKQKIYQPNYNNKIDIKNLKEEYFFKQLNLSMSSKGFHGIF